MTDYRKTESTQCTKKIFDPFIKGRNYSSLLESQTFIPLELIVPEPMVFPSDLRLLEFVAGQV